MVSPDARGEKLNLSSSSGIPLSTGRTGASLHPERSLLKVLDLWQQPGKGKELPGKSSSPLGTDHWPAAWLQALVFGICLHPSGPKLFENLQKS